LWFRVVHHQKYRIRKMAGIKAQVPSAEKGEKGEENNNLSQNFDEEEEEPI
jgi:hypothetical protein